MDFDIPRKGDIISTLAGEKQIQAVKIKERNILTVENVLIIGLKRHKCKSLNLLSCINKHLTFNPRFHPILKWLNHT